LLRPKLFSQSQGQNPHEVSSRILKAKTWPRGQVWFYITAFLYFHLQLTPLYSAFLQSSMWN